MRIELTHDEGVGLYLDLKEVVLHNADRKVVVVVENNEIWVEIGEEDDTIELDLDEEE